MRYLALCLGIAPILALAADGPIEHFMIGRWVILFDESLTRYAPKVSDDTRAALEPHWRKVGDFDISSTTVTFHRSAGEETFSYEILRTTDDAIALRLYHNHRDYVLSLGRDDENLLMPAGSCDLTQEDCGLAFYFRRHDEDRGRRAVDPKASQ